MKELRAHVHSMNKQLSNEYLESLNYFQLMSMVHPYYVEYFQKLILG